MEADNIKDRETEAKESRSTSKSDPGKGNGETKKVKRKEAKDSGIINSALLMRTSDISGNSGAQELSENTEIYNYTEKAEQKRNSYLTRDKTKRRKKQNFTTISSDKQDLRTKKENKEDEPEYILEGEHDLDTRTLGGFNSSQETRERRSTQKYSSSETHVLGSDKGFTSSEEVMEDDAVKQWKVGKPLFEEDNIIMDDDFSPNTQQTSRTFKEGTVGGKLFEVRTLTEISGFLNLGNVSKMFLNTLKCSEVFNIRAFWLSNVEFNC